MTVSQDAMVVLDRCRVDGNTLFLPAGQLDRKLYESVNKVLECMGGKWNRKAKGHVFDADPADALDAVLLTGEITDVKKEFQFFETPGSLAARMAEMADIKPTDDILEPSAGRGAIVVALRKYRFRSLTMFELSRENYAFLSGLKLGTALHDDFLKEDCGGFKFDKIVMNPPFSRSQDCDHVTHAYSMLRTPGLLVAIMSEGAFFRETAKARIFRALNPWSECLPEGTFKSSGTMVRSRLVRLEK